MASEDLEEVIKVQAAWCRKGEVPTTLACVHWTESDGCTHDNRSSIPYSTDCAGVIHVKRLDYLNWKLTGGSD